MEHLEGPPVYSEYPTELPKTFPVGRHKVQPLVNVTELQAHLRLLGAIYKLKQDVQARQDGIAATNSELAWVVDVNRAIWRFYKWTSSSWSLGSPGLSEEAMPPIDVIMVWHLIPSCESLPITLYPSDSVSFRIPVHTTRTANGWIHSTAAI